MNRIFGSLIALCLSVSSFALRADDYTDKAVKATKFGDWILVEFAADKQIFYKIATEALNQNLKETYISFYIAPSAKCEPSTAEMNTLMGEYSDALAQGYVPMSYKIPGQKEHTEVVDTRMTKENPYAFFKFHDLSLKKLLISGNHGNLSIWVPGSGNGSVHGSSNMYFSMRGINQAFEMASKLCRDDS